MMHCPNCGMSVQEDVKVCPNCEFPFVQENKSGDKLIGCIVGILFFVVVLVISSAIFLVYQFLNTPQTEQNNKTDQLFKDFQYGLQRELDQLLHQHSKQHQNHQNEKLIGKSEHASKNQTRSKETLKPLVAIQHHEDVENDRQYKPYESETQNQSNYLNKAKPFRTYTKTIKNEDLSKTYDQIVNAVAKNDPEQLQNVFIVNQEVASKQQINNWLALIKNKDLKQSFIHHFNTQVDEISRANYEMRYQIDAKGIKLLYVTKLKTGYQFEIPIHDFSFSSDLDSETTIDVFGKTIKYKPKRFEYYHLYLPVGQYTLPMTKTDRNKTFKGQLNVFYDQYYQANEQFKVIDLYIYPSFSVAQDSDKITYHVNDETGTLNIKEKHVGLFDNSKPLEVYLVANQKGKKLKSEVKKVDIQNHKSNVHYLYLNIDFK